MSFLAVVVSGDPRGCDGNDDMARVASKGTIRFPDTRRCCEHSDQ